MSDPAFLLRQLHGACKELRRQQREWRDGRKSQSAAASLRAATQRVDDMLDEFERNGWLG